MYPVLFNIGPWSISTFGVFLSLGFLSAVFVIWRLSLAYDYDREKILDLILLTFFGSLITSRLFFVFTHISQFMGSSLLSFEKVILFNRYPGLSFWGGLIGALIISWFFAKKLKINFWHVADIGISGCLLALSIGSIGCFFGGCQYGLPSNLPIAVSQVSLVGKRFPLQLIESLFFFFVFLYLWKASLRFHFAGRIFSLGLIIMGIIKLLLEPFRGDTYHLLKSISIGTILSLTLIASGIFLYYTLGKRSLKNDYLYLKKIVLNPKARQIMLSNLKKKWYNLKVDWKISLQKQRRDFLRKINVKSNPPKI